LAPVDRQCRREPVWQCSAVREGKRAVLGIEVWAMQPRPPPPPELSTTRRRPEPRFWFSSTRELEELALGKGRAEARMKRKTARVHSHHLHPLTRCHGACRLEAQTVDSQPSAPAHATASSRAPAVACRRSHMPRRRAKFRQRVRGDAFLVRPDISPIKVCPTRRRRDRRQGGDIVGRPPIGSAPQLRRRARQCCRRR